MLGNNSRREEHITRSTIFQENPNICGVSVVQIPHRYLDKDIPSDITRSSDVFPKTNISTREQREGESKHLRQTEIQNPEVLTRLRKETDHFDAQNFYPEMQNQGPAFNTTSAADPVEYTTVINYQPEVSCEYNPIPEIREEVVAECSPTQNIQAETSLKEPAEEIESKSATEELTETPSRNPEPSNIQVGQS